METNFWKKRKTLGKKGKPLGTLSKRIEKTNDEFECNQDNSIEFDTEYRSPGWDRYKKNKILKWKK